MKGHLFGHFDSRGGSSLILEDDKEKACYKYDTEILYWSEEEMAEFGRPSDEDFIKTVWVGITECFDYERLDLLYYDERGQMAFGICKVKDNLEESTMEIDDETGLPRMELEYLEENLVGIWIGDQPKHKRIGNLIFVCLMELGEDAFGLITA